MLFSVRWEIARKNSDSLRKIVSLFESLTAKYFFKFILGLDFSMRYSVKWKWNRSIYKIIYLFTNYLFGNCQIRWGFLWIKFKFAHPYTYEFYLTIHMIWKKKEKIMFQWKSYFRIINSFMILKHSLDGDLKCYHYYIAHEKLLGTQLHESPELTNYSSIIS
jgi:hypothetical protein